MKKTLTVFLLLFSMVNSWAAEEKAVSIEASVKAEFETTFPGMPVDSVAITPVSGIYEIVSGDKIFYFAPASGHVITGAIWSKEGENLTAKTVERLTTAKAQANYALLSAALDKAVKVGNGKNVVIELTDPDCPYCRKMHEYWKTRSDITRYIFLMPIPELHPDAEAKSRYILASVDREKALEEVFSGKFDSAAPPEGDDKGMFPIHEEITGRTGIKGTPAFFVNDRFVHGADIPAIEEIIGVYRKEEPAPALK
ncbi:MAG: DsbC family protein [Nitrospirota bacterium]|nr:DsbC family protein [Nitrospirota bacterium]